MEQDHPTIETAASGSSTPGSNVSTPSRLQILRARTRELRRSGNEQIAKARNLLKTSPLSVDSTAGHFFPEDEPSPMATPSALSPSGSGRLAHGAYQQSPQEFTPSKLPQHLVVEEENEALKQQLRVMMRELNDTRTQLESTRKNPKEAGALPTTRDEALLAQVKDLESVNKTLRDQSRAMSEQLHAAMQTSPSSSPTRDTKRSSSSSPRSKNTPILGAMGLFPTFSGDSNEAPDSDANREKRQVRSQQLNKTLSDFLAEVTAKVTQLEKSKKSLTAELETLKGEDQHMQGLLSSLSRELNQAKDREGQLQQELDLTKDRLQMITVDAGAMEAELRQALEQANSPQPEEPEEDLIMDEEVGEGIEVEQSVVISPDAPDVSQLDVSTDLDDASKKRLHSSQVGAMHSEIAYLESKNSQLLHKVQELEGKGGSQDMSSLVDKLQAKVLSLEETNRQLRASENDVEAVADHADEVTQSPTNEGDEVIVANIRAMYENRSPSEDKSRSLQETDNEDGPDTSNRQLFPAEDSQPTDSADREIPHMSSQPDDGNDHQNQTHPDQDMQMQLQRTSMAIVSTQKSMYDARFSAMEMELGELRDDLEKAYAKASQAEEEVESGRKQLALAHKMNDELREQVQELVHSNHTTEQHMESRIRVLQSKVKTQEGTDEEHLSSVPSADSQRDIHLQTQKSSQSIIATERAISEARCSALEMEVEELKETLESVRVQAEQRDEIAERATNDLREALSEKNKLHEQIGQLTSKLRSFQSTNQRSTDQLETESGDGTPTADVEDESGVLGETDMPDRSLKTELETMEAEVVSAMAVERETSVKELAEASTMNEDLTKELRKARKINKKLSVQVRGLLDKVASLSMSYKELLSRIADFEMQQSEQESENHVSRQVHRTSMTIVSTQLAEASLHRSALEVELGEVRDQNEALAAQLKSATDKLETTLEELNESREAMEQLQSTGDNSADQARELQDRVAALERENVQLHDTLLEQHDEIQQSQEEIKMHVQQSSRSIVSTQRSMYDARCGALEIDIEKLQHEVEDATAKLQTSNNRIEELQLAVRAEQDTSRSLRDKLDTLENENQQLQDEMLLQHEETLLSQEEIQRQVQKSSASMVSTQRAMYDARCSTLEMEVEELKEKLSKATAKAQEDLAMRNKELDSSVQEVEELKTGIQSRQETVDSLRDKIAALESENQQLQDDMLLQHEEMLMSQEEIQQQVQKSSASMVSTQRAMYDARCSSLEMEVEELKEKMSTATAKAQDDLAMSSKELNSFVREVEELKTGIQSRQETVDSLRNKIATLECENQQLHDDLLLQHEEMLVSQEEIQQQVQKSSASMVSTQRAMYDARCSSLEMEVEELKEKVSEAAIKAEEDQATSRENISSSAQEVEELKTAVRTGQETVELLRSEMATLERENQQLHDDMLMQHDEMLLSQEELQQHMKKSAASMASTQRAMYDAKCSALEMEVSELKEQVEEASTAHNESLAATEKEVAVSRALADDLDSHQTKLEALQRENLQLHDDLLTQHDALLHSQEEIQAQVQKSSMTMVSTQRAMYDARCAALEMEVAELKLQAEKLESEKSAAMEEAVVSKRSIELNTSKMSDSQQGLAILEERIASLENENHQLHDELLSQHEETLQSREEVQLQVEKSSASILATQKSMYEARCSALEAELDEVKQNSEKMAMTYNESLESSQNELAVNRQLAVELATGKLEETNRLQALQEKIGALEVENSQLHNDLLAQHETVLQSQEELQTQVRKSVTSIASTQKAMYEAKCSALEMDVAKLDEKLASAHSEASQLREALEESRKDLSSSHQDNKELEDRVDASASEIQEVKRHMESQIMELQAKAESFESLEADRRGAQREIHLQTQKSSRSIVATERAISDARCSALEAEIEELQDILKVAKAEAGNREVLTEKATDDLRAALDEKTRLLDEIGALQAQLRDANARLNERDEEAVEAEIENKQSIDSTSRALPSIPTTGSFSHFDDLEAALHSLREEFDAVSRLVEQGNGSAGDVAEVCVMNEDLSVEIVPSLKTNEDLPALIQNLLDKIGSLGQSYQELLDKMKTFETSHTGGESEAAGGASAQRGDKLDEQMQELEAASHTNSELTDKVGELQATSESSRKELQILRDSSNQQIAELQAVLRQTQGELGESRIRGVDLSARYETLESKFHESQQENDRLLAERELAECPQFDADTTQREVYLAKQLGLSKSSLQQERHMLSCLSSELHDTMVREVEMREQLNVALEHIEALSNQPVPSKHAAAESGKRAHRDVEEDLDVTIRTRSFDPEDDGNSSAGPDSSTLKAMEASLLAAQRQFEEARSENETLRQELEELHGRAALLQRQLDVADNSNETLRDELQDVREQVAELEESLEEDEEEEQRSMMRMEDMKSSLSSVTTVLHQMTDQNNALSTRVSELESELADERVQRLDMLVQQADQRAKTNLTEVSAEMEATMAVNVGLADEVSRLMAELAVATDGDQPQEVVDAKLATLHVEMDKLRVSKNLLKDEVESLRKELHAAVEKQSETDQELLESRDALNSSRMEAESSHAREDILQAKLDAATTQLITFRQDSKQRYRGLQLEMEQVRQEVDDATDANDLLKDVIAKLNEMNDSLEEQRRRLSEENSHLRTQNKNFALSIEKLQDFTERMKHSDIEKEFYVLMDECKFLRTQKKEFVRSQTKMEEQMASFAKEREAFSDRENKLQLRVDALIMANKQLEKNLHTKESRTSKKLDASVTRTKWLDKQLEEAQKSVLELSACSKSMREAHAEELESASHREDELRKEAEELRIQASVEESMKEAEAEKNRALVEKAYAGMEDLQADVERLSKENEKLLAERDSLTLAAQDAKISASASPRRRRKAPSADELMPLQPRGDDKPKPRRGHLAAAWAVSKRNLMGGE